MRANNKSILIWKNNAINKLTQPANVEDIKLHTIIIQMLIIAY
jgi:hypothetical protein